ncbi:DoxX family membrane protein [Cellulomonas sp. PhB150]|uniref:DoxX family membrane protein n=1 Tax=Cellulomonas sp. PhB150 TaxID=2485188 RepID=UPI000F4AE228|nr:DoxX family membrane protein [Cellulomonas sp. PhB150]ROS27792.1 DoxX-like protein [Cellulomonas sp. PhB150]
MLLRRIARPLFATWFITEGLDVVRHPAAHAADARGALKLLEKRFSVDVPELSDRQLTTAVQAHGVALAGAGALLAVGRAPRTAALALAVLTAPLIVVNLPDKEADRDATLKKARRERLVRALAFTGGAILAGIDLEGRPGVTRRVQDAWEARPGVSWRAQNAWEHHKPASDD